MAHCPHTIAAALAAEERLTAHDHITSIEQTLAGTLRSDVSTAKTLLELIVVDSTELEHAWEYYDSVRASHDSLTQNSYFTLPDTESERLLAELSDLRDDLREFV
jgi:hypothetical protein